MLQDIKPHTIRNEYQNKKPEDSDFVLIFWNDFVYLKNGVLDEADKSDKSSLKIPSLKIPKFDDFLKIFPKIKDDARYIFSIDEKSCFLVNLETEIIAGKIEDMKLQRLRNVLGSEPEVLDFACATAFHLSKWYKTHQFCSCCGKKMKHEEDERALYCPRCDFVEYPKIAPVVIVGVRDDEELLLVKNVGAAESGYKNYALVAGFVEIGETLEETVRREMMEEVGIRVKNITYYKSQPWAFSESLLAGFFADLDGDKTIHLDENELSEAIWVSRNEIPAPDSVMSLTGDMIEAFRTGKIE
ncbi:NADH pyrophosphatase [Methanimicrococcus hongohii]|uniref:NAD(+) diphosphatase n=1 Tax=Methanimicrococcus hongohii TaxID=3028295 RepID=A0AA96V258_9EURY|nr:NAD(+) diphosphatase [Methanimicrococcus sp. Hf6]WNY23985.1 NADH pyrophosphatase [Methanimicrococcus sp. Hf6]